jgi:DNA polymerase/3'-5' exonuclease PolX
MAELLLIVSLIGIFAFGFYIMCRLDRFLEENRKALLKENESREPSEILLPQGLSESEILCEIRRFRETHGNVDIILSDGKEDEY